MHRAIGHVMAHPGQNLGAVFLSSSHLPGRRDACPCAQAGQAHLRPARAPLQTMQMQPERPLVSEVSIARRSGPCRAAIAYMGHVAGCRGCTLEASIGAPSYIPSDAQCAKPARVRASHMGRASSGHPCPCQATWCLSPGVTGAHATSARQMELEAGEGPRQSHPLRARERP